MVHGEFCGWELVLAIMTNPRGTFAFPPLRAAQLTGTILFVLDLSGTNI